MHWLHRTIHNALRSENVIAECVVKFRDRREVFPAQAQVHSEGWFHLPIVLREQSIVRRAVITNRNRRRSSGRIYLDLFIEAARIVGKVQQSAELVVRTRGSRLIIVVLLAPRLHAELPRMAASYPAKCVRQAVSVLGGSLRRCTRLRDADESMVYCAKTSRIEIKQSNVRNAEVRISHRLPLIKRKSCKVRAQFIQHRPADGARPADRAHIIIRLQGDVVNRPRAAVKIVELYDVRARKEL